MNFMHSNFSRSIAIIAFAAVAQVSFAQTTFTLTQDNCTGGCGTSPYGQVVVTQNGSALDFVASLFNNNTFINTGFPATLAFNLAGSPTVSITGLTAGWSVSTSPPLHMDGAGNLGYGVLWGTQGGGHGTLGPVSFSVSSAGGLTLASLVANSGGVFMAVDIFSSQTQNTGIVAAVPEPENYALMLVGLGVVGFIARRRTSHPADLI